MTNGEIIKKAMTKAIKNGWKECTTTYDSDIYDFNTYSAYFNHDFAKAFWGEEIESFSIKGKGGDVLRIAWRHHLQAMVISPDPLKYIEKYL